MELIKIPRKAPIFLAGALVALNLGAAIITGGQTEKLKNDTNYVVYAKETEVVKRTFVEPEYLPDCISVENVITPTSLSYDEIELIALITMAEAEGEDEMGKRLVIDSILHRVECDHGYLPDTVYDVIYQPNAFEPVWNGRMDRCEVRDDIRQLVVEEIENRTNYDIVYFTAGEYNPYGTPMFQHGNHYFSSH